MRYLKSRKREDFLNGYSVEVDVNGTGKPNSATGERPDRYKFDIYYNGRVELNSSYDSYAMARTFLETSLNNKKKNY